MKLVLASDLEKSIDVLGQIVPASTADKMKNGFKNFALLFGLAIFSIFIPVLHFVLVPLFLLASLFGFAKGFNMQFQIVNSSPVNCVKCSHSFLLPPFINAEFRVLCGHCKAQFRLETTA